jgi:SAM-dependent methyltransferase
MTAAGPGAAAIDGAKVEAFVGKVLGDLAGLFTAKLATIGDRLGLWKDLAANGSATSAAFAARTGIAERYAREWLAGMHAAGYVDYDAATGVYALPPEHAPALADESGPVFFGGCLQEIEGMSGIFDSLCEAFRTGGGVPQSSYTGGFYEGLCRFTSSWHENHLLQTWVPSMPEVEAKLQAGCDVADVGTGAGLALIKLAQAYPANRYVGYDVFPGQVELARKAVAEAGVADRVRVEVCDAANGLPDSFDVITTFDVIHDAVDPAGVLRSIREALRPDGRYVCLDINASHRPEENVGPLATLFYGFSVHYCMTTSLAQGGTGLGTVGFNPKVVDEMCAEAGFASVRRVEIDNPFNHLYEARV